MPKMTGKLFTMIISLISWGKPIKHHSTNVFSQLISTIHSI